MDTRNQTKNYVEAIKEKLRALVPKAAESGWWEDAKWNCKVKWALNEIAQAHGLHDYFRGANAHKCGGEWLFDVSWLKVNNREEIYDSLISLELAAEIEWGSWNDIDDDFEKLMVSRANLRLIVFDNWASKSADIEKCLNRLQEKLRIYQGSEPGDQYLVAVYRCKNEDGTKLKPYKPDFRFYILTKNGWRPA